jgi:hypothetical protein
MILFGMLVILLAVAALAGVFSSDVSTLKTPTIDIEAADVTSLSVSVGGDVVAFERVGDSWRMTAPINFPADQNRVDGLLRSLESTEVGSLVTENPDRYSVYGITDSAAAFVRLTFAAGEEELRLGGKTPAQRGDYIRLGSDKRVFKLAPRVSIAQGADLWRDKQILPSEARRSTFISVTRPDEAYGLDGNDGWRFDDGSLADSVKVAQFVGRYGNLRADSFLDSLDAGTVRSEADYIVALRDSDVSFDVFFRPFDNEYVAVARSDAEAVYRIPASRLATLVPERSALQQ